MSHTPLNQKAPLDAAVDIAEGAAITWYAGKTVSQDPNRVKHEGRIVPTIRVNNDAEWAAAAVGTSAITDVIMHLFGILWIVPFALLSYAFWMGPGAIVAGIWLLIAGTPVPNGVVIPFIVIGGVAWFYWVLWRWTIRRFFRWLLHSGPRIERTENYHGVFNGVPR